MPSVISPQMAEAAKKTQFKKGNPGGGRKPGSVSLTDAIRRVVQREYTHTDPLTGMKDTKQVRDWIGIALAGKAMKGDVAAIREMLERLEGKVTDKVEVTGKDGRPLEIDHTARLSTAHNRITEAFAGGPGLIDSGLPADRSLLLTDGGSKS